MKRVHVAWYPALILALTVAGCGRTGSPTGAPSTNRVVVVAAESQYGSIARAIGGDRVQVFSLLTNPNTDPHLFEASPSTARVVSTASLVIENGLGYDSWLDKLMSAAPSSRRVVVTVGTLLGKRTGDNPHVWYLPSGWPKEAQALTSALIKLDGSHAAYYRGRESAWLASLRPIYRTIASVRRVVAGQNVIATEPVYGYMLASLRVHSLDYPFQKAIMDGTDPSPQSVAEFEADLTGHRVRLLFYNSQVSSPSTVAMRTLATQTGVPRVGVTETEPPSVGFVQWQQSQLLAIRSKWH